MSNSDPSLQWQVERDLAYEPAGVWRATGVRVAAEGSGAELLSRQDEDGQWAGGANFPADAQHVNLLGRLDTHRDEVLRYAHNPNVPFTNHGSEHDVRPRKIRTKIAGCLRTMSGAEASCRMRPYLSTARKQGQSTFAAMRLLHEHTPWVPAIPTTHP